MAFKNGRKYNGLLWSENIIEDGLIGFGVSKTHSNNDIENDLIKIKMDVL